MGISWLVFDAFPYSPCIDLVLTIDDTHVQYYHMDVVRSLTL